MCRKLIYLTSFILVLSSSGSTSARLVGYWKLDEGSGTIAHDSSRNGNNGTFKGVGDPNWVAGKIGDAVKFDAIDGYIDCGNDRSISDFSETYSIEAWTYFEEAADYPGLFQRGDKTTSSQIEIYLQPAANLTTVHNRDSIYYAYWSPVPLNQWTHITVVWEKQAWKVYYDGIEQIQTGGGGTVTNPETGKTCYIGLGYTDHPMNGIIDDMRIYDHALMEEEILFTMEGGVEYPYALNPDPANGVLHSDTWVTLSWRAGAFAISHDVYLGDDFDVVENATRDSDDNWHHLDEERENWYFENILPLCASCNQSIEIAGRNKDTQLRKELWEDNLKNQAIIHSRSGHYPSSYGCNRLGFFLSVTHYGDLDRALTFSAEALQSLRPAMKEPLILDTMQRSVENWIDHPDVSPLTRSKIALQIGLVFFDYEEFDEFRKWMRLTESLTRKAAPAPETRIVLFRVQQHVVYADYLTADTNNALIRMQDRLKRLKDKLEDDINRAIPEARAVTDQHELDQLVRLGETTKAVKLWESIKDYWKIDSDNLRWLEDIDNPNPTSVTQWLLIGLRIIEAEIKRQQGDPDWQRLLERTALFAKQRRIRKAWKTKLNALMHYPKTGQDKSLIDELIKEPQLPLPIRRTCDDIRKKLEGTLLGS